MEFTKTHPTTAVYLAHPTYNHRDPDPPRRKQEELKVFVKPLNSEVAIPELRLEGDAGFDLKSTEDLMMMPGEILLIPTGLAMEIPIGYMGKIHSKSGLVLAGLIIHGGVIDSNYCGHIRVIAEN